MQTTGVWSGSELLIVCGIMALSLLVAFCWLCYVARDSMLRLLTYGQFLENLTVVFVVCSVFVLAIQRVLTGETSATILSGIVGYVLGARRSARTEGAAPRKGPDRTSLDVAL